MSNQKELIAKINQLKKDKNAVILVHYYQRLNMYSIADYIGDSLQLSKQAANTDADIIVFCGVYFMAETAKILSPNKKVYLPSLMAGCKMADMITVEDLRKLKHQHPGSPVVCYVNSTAAVKAESDICCTSANGVEVVKSLSEKKVIFVPDKGLGAYIARFVPDKEIILFDGYCPTHWDIKPEDIIKTREKHPDALVLVHPECDKPLIDMADYVGSTSGIYKFAQQSNNKNFIVGSEVGILLYMQQNMPEKKFILPSPKARCSNMKRNTMGMVVDCLENGTNEIFVDNTISKKAYNSIHRMLNIS